ncbi:acetyl-CoA synthetase-like protein [Rhizopogon vinicolor AM-OR11-026]|uniref:Acetyl-CoA synthetase-like protein n=1 Tax=Rhizopogon vinicolor AM-OR11-026 TaxID=1314800 RepID=A0A1B7MQZ4_9AGAM|nr:acetyl-CoA synthetase-like protein [Rhizopogon vinicolor AM-OR11-026]
MAVSDYLVTDDLTVLLGFIGVTVFLLQNLYKPQPLVHPILLGRQSDAGRVRHPGESTVYRNYGTGLLGRFPVRPDKDVNVVNDFLKPEFDAPRTLWSTKITNAQLKTSISAFGSGIARLVSEESTVLILLNDCIEFLISDLALSEQSIASITLNSPKLLTGVLEMHRPDAIITDATFLPHVLELIYDAREHHHKIIVVGESDSNLKPKGMKEVEIYSWNEVESTGKVPQAPKNTPQSDSPYTVSFFESPSGERRGVQLTHENFTSGVTAIKSLFPVASSLSTLDTIVSAHSLSTPYGRAIAYTALFEGASFATLPSTTVFHVKDAPTLDVTDVLSAINRIPSPTVLFLKPEHVQSLTSAVISRAKKSFFLYPLAWRHKFAGLREGFLSKDSLWDRTVFDGAREAVLGKMADTLKAVVISGGPLPFDSLAPARIALSVPLINIHTHGSAAGPLFATHASDMQMLPSSSATPEPAHVGAPSINVEAKLVGVDDDVVEKGADPIGEILVRGPPVGSMLSAEGESGEKNAWVQTGEKGRVMTNGAFKVLGFM